MTAAEALLAAEAVGIPLRLVGDRVRAPQAALDALPADLRAALHDHRDRIAAVLRLRELHAGIGVAPDDLRFVEAALLSGHVSDVRIVAAPPKSIQ